MATTAIVGLLIYSILIVFYVVFLCWTGWSLSSWDIVPEIVVLALPTVLLENTGVGYLSDSYGHTSREQAMK
jgi:TRAP-type C4-dicarboxylate transport system permease small subunit